MRSSENPGTVRRWWKSGAPWIWLNAAAVGTGILAVVGLFALLAVRGLAHFWPAEVIAFDYRDGGTTRHIMGELVGQEAISLDQYREATPDQLGEPGDLIERWLIKTGNRREAAPDFRWVFAHRVTNPTNPPDVIVFERTEWGNAYGFATAIAEDGVTVFGKPTWLDLSSRIERAADLRARIEALRASDIYEIDHQLERLRLERRQRALAGSADFDDIESQEARLQSDYEEAAARLAALTGELARDAISIRLMDGSEATVALASILRAWQPNRMNTTSKLGHYLASLWGFLSDAPREANTEGGVFPAIFGTVMMVLVMSVLVTPFGVVAALYLREYSRQGNFVRLIRIAVNNLAGVPSIVYGVFGLGFFVYVVGGTLDDLFFREAHPAPTFGTPGLLWASLTLALLTVPVVIVSTEEGLARIPRTIREGSMALGATKAETLFRIVLPMASPSILTGVILAVARAAGEVVPLMLVGVVKLAPALPVDGTFPFIHLERKFMHLGFHIYDLGFQSPNVAAAGPLVYATACLLVVIVVVLNLSATVLRSRLEARYRYVEN